MRVSLLIFAICFLLCLPARAQREWDNWYFGHKAGIAFSSGAAVTLPVSAISTLEGCASISDREGNLLFYTDGMSVWNRTHDLMPNGSFLGGDTSSTQSALIVSQPGSRTRYYIFTPARAETEPTFGLQYSIVDLNAASGGGLGDVVLKNELLLATSTEKVTAIRHRNGIDVWIVAHEIDSDVFCVYLLTGSGVQPIPVRSQTGTPYPQGIGYLKASPDGKRLAAAADFSLFEVYNFNNATGKVSNPISIPTDIPHICYGVEFSPNGQFLYGSKAFDIGDVFSNTELWQYDLNAGTPEQIQQSAVTIASFSWQESPMGAMQIGPDKRIYIARAASHYVSVIDEPNQRGTACNFIDKGVDLLKGVSQYGLPNFHPAVAVPEFFYSNTCFGDSTYFTIATDLLPVDSVFWDFGDPAVAPHDTSSKIKGAYLYSSPGVYTVLMTIRRNGIIETFSRDITIAPQPLVDLGSDRSFCSGSELVLTAGEEKFDSYLWSTGASTASITVSQPGTYWLRVSRDICQATDTIVVSLRTPSITATGDTALCRHGSAQLAAFSTEDLVYLWEPADGLNNPSVPMPVARPTVTTTYTVTGTAKDGCTTKATVTVIVSDPFSLDLGPNRTICADTKTILDATTTGATYLWSTGERTPTITVTTQGLYSVVVTVSNCTAEDAVFVSVVESHITADPDQTICRGSSVQLQASGALSYEWSPTEGLDDPRSATPQATPQATTTYRVVGTAAAGCSDTAYVTITVQEPFIVDLGPDTTICAGTTVELRAPIANARYRWSTGDTTETITVQEAGLYSIVITSGVCRSYDELYVGVSTPSVAIATPNTSICLGDGVQLAAYGAVSYWWSPATGLSDPASATPFARPDRTTVYTVTGTNEHGCTSTAYVTVEVIDGIGVLFSLPTVSDMLGAAGVALPLTATTSADKLPLTLRNISIEVRINASVFIPTPSPTDQWTVRREGDDIVITFAPGNVVLTDPGQVLTTITGKLLVSPLTSASLRFGKIEHERCIIPSTKQGTLFINGCFIDSRAIRLFIRPSIEVMPNPASDEARLRLKAIEQGTAQLALYTIEGKLVQEQAIAVTSNDQIVALPVHTISPGLYRVALATGTGVITTLLHVVH